MISKIYECMFSWRMPQEPRKATSETAVCCQPPLLQLTVCGRELTTHSAGELVTVGGSINWESFRLMRTSQKRRAFEVQSTAA
jgi:hypothetical protein